ncbi:MAG TPA: MFS transporter [Anaerolineaceae bacterium]|nr:MFS transporter [Anaerolineaceae bacterium]
MRNRNHFMETSPKALLDQTKSARQARRAWYMYDFGNSSYAAIVLLAVYSAYFKNAVVGGAEGTRLWGWSVGIAAVLVALISPILGSIADFSRSKKRLLFIFTTLSVIFTAMLFFVRAGDVITGMVFFILAEIGYRGAQVFYDALLVDISTPQTIGYISGKGWAVGMVGGVISLLFVLVPIQLIGNAFIPFAFLIAAFFYLLSSLPIYLKVRELTEPEIIPAGESVFSVALKKLGTTFRDVRNYKEFIKYMAAFLIYNDGIMMLMDFAAIIGATLFGMEQVQLILFVIVIQITGALGALLFGKISDKQSSKQAITISLVVLMISLVGIFFIKSMTMFFVIGAFAGFALSGAQAVSRTMVSQLAPAGKTTEFYGFLSVAGRTSTFVGPLVFSTVSYRMHNFYINHGMAELAAEQAGLFWAVGAIILFLIVGFFILLSVRKVTAQEPMIYS